MLLLQDFTKIFIDYSKLINLTKKVEIAFNINYKLVSFVIILKDVTKKEFRKIIDKHNIEESILFNPYEQ